MSLVPYDPFRHLENVRRDFDRFFNTEFPSLFPRLSEAINVPRIDLHETENEYIVSCDLPGLEKKEDVNIDINNNILTISGSIQHGQEVQEERLHHRERFVGRFQRAITLPSNASSENIRASYKNGVLDVHIPKKNDDTRKRINIEFH